MGMTTVVITGAKGRFQPQTVQRARAGGYSVRPLKGRRSPVVRLSEATERTFRAISDPKNAHLFSKEAAFAAFAHLAD